MIRQSVDFAKKMQRSSVDQLKECGNENDSVFAHHEKRRETHTRVSVNRSRFDDDRKR